MPSSTTQICQTQNQYSGSLLTTSTQTCYRTQDIYIGYLIEIIFISLIVIVLWKISKEL